VCYIGGQWWLSRLSTCGVRVMASNANIVNFGAFSWTVLRFCNVCNSATDFFSFVVRRVVVLRENAAVSVCVLLFWLNKVVVHLFCDLFVLMLLQK